MPIPYKKIDCSAPGIVRKGRGRGFEYFLEGRRVEDGETLSRIRNLGIPPAWKDVWICVDPKGHIQAIGTDAAGRKQYLYHEAWRRRRDQQKFDKMVRFAEVLPKVRVATNDHLVLPGMPRERALACAVRLLDRGFFRLGGETYAETNQTYGLATIRKDHVKLTKGEVMFDYIAKSGKQRLQSVVDPMVYDAVLALKRRRGGGPELLAYRHGKVWRDIRSDDINEYLKALAGDEYSAKDFRTWHATVYCALALAVSFEAAASKTARKRAIARAVKEVAHYLGNTPTVCRKSYIDPRVIDRFGSGKAIGSEVLDRVGAEDPFAEGSLNLVEEAVLQLVTDHSDSPLVEDIAAA